MQSLLSAEQVQSIIRDALPEAETSQVSVELVADGAARVRVPFSPRMLRPGGRVSGPTLFAAIDTAMYAVVLGHIGEQRMAVTSDMSLHFLRACAPRDIVADAQILRLGRRLAVISVSVGADGDPPAVHATGSYALPPAQADA